GRRKHATEKGALLAPLHLVVVAVGAAAGCAVAVELGGGERNAMAREKKEVLPAPPFIPVISRAHRRCVFKEKVSLEELPSAISSLTHLTDMANLFSLQGSYFIIDFVEIIALNSWITDVTNEDVAPIFHGTSLSAKECEICDFFVYIPQYGGGIASLNVTVAASIILHHFGVWAGFGERSRDGNKFVVAKRLVKQVRRNFCTETEDDIVEEQISVYDRARELFSII
ncbi:hypothetical protein S245_012941, partial [Arachis hypogaea]